MINKVKKIAADILFMDDSQSIQDNDSLILVHGFSSIDFIDFCYELKNKIDPNLEPEQLWPFTKMLLDKAFYDGENWSPKGWEEVCNALKIEKSTPKLRMDGLYHYFTPLYVVQRIESLK